MNNGAVIPLDSSGRPDVDVWGDGAYFVEVFDTLGVKQGEADHVSIPGGGSLTIPVLDSGKFLTNNGAVLLWSSIREVPDPTGMGGKVLGTDGENLLWQLLPHPPDPQYTISTDVIKIGAFMIQFGRDSAPASGNSATLKIVTFPKPFNGTPYFVKASVTAVRATSSSLVAESVSGASATSATFNFVTADSKEKNSDVILSPIPFDWVAFGQGVT
ncbi:MAG TPA: gp53-like domain-containing protein [Xylella sp.]